MSKITPQLGDFENQNYYKTVMFKIEIITNYEILTSKSIGNIVANYENHF